MPLSMHRVAIPNPQLWPERSSACEAVILIEEPFGDFGHEHRDLIALKRKGDFEGTEIVIGDVDKHVQFVRLDPRCRG